MYACHLLRIPYCQCRPDVDLGNASHLATRATTRLLLGSPEEYMEQVHGASLVACCLSSNSFRARPHVGQWVQNDKRHWPQMYHSKEMDADGTVVSYESAI